RVFSADDLANGQNILFCATGISDSALLRGVRAHGGVTAVTHSILMRAKSKTVRFIRARHNLQMKTIRLRSDNREHLIRYFNGKLNSLVRLRTNAEFCQRGD